MVVREAGGLAVRVRFPAARPNKKGRIISSLFYAENFLPLTPPFFARLPDGKNFRKCVVMQDFPQPKNPITGSGFCTI